MNEKNLSISEHVKDLRRMLLVSLVAIVIGTLISYGIFLDKLMLIATEPITSLGIGLKFISVSEGFLAHLKVALLGGFILASPIVLWQILYFILPALYKNERKIFLSILFFALLLFLIGLFFGYYVVLRLALNTLIFDFSGNLEPFITVENYFNFIMRFMLPFGGVFEIPLFVYFFTKMGLVTPEKLVKARKYIIVIVLILAAILTPPDVISQLLLGIPMYFLFEVSIILSKIIYKRKLALDKKRLENY